MRRRPGMKLPARQRGLAMLVLLALFATAAAYLLVSALNKGTTALSIAKSDKNMAVMQEAKAALIAWAAAQALKDTTLIPGSLPCPDNNNDGFAEGTCTGAQRLGRLPYKTLGIGELRDASGELLWYGMSRNFRNYTNTVNSDTLGTITVSGLTPATLAVAVVLAPGTRVGTQDRSPGGAGCNASGQPCNTAANYLEDLNGDAINDSYIAATENLINPSITPYPFNDQLIVITKQDLMAAVEPVIAARIQRDIVRQYIYDPSDTSTSTQWSDTAGPNKSRYYDAWGGFPFAATFVNQTGGSASSCPSIYTATAGRYEGLLPVVRCLSYTWSSGSVVQTGGSGTVWAGSSCTSASSNTQLRCDIWYISGAPTIRISGTVNNVGRSFVQLPRKSDVSCSGCTLSSRSLSGSLNGAGAGIVTLNATMSAVGGSWVNAIVTIDDANLITNPLISPTDGIAGWFTTNSWHQQTYFAVSPGYAPGGAGTCNPTSPKCITVDNLNPPYTNPTTDTRAILIFAGRSLGGATRPNATLSDYLEAKNASTGNYSFENSITRTTSSPGAPTSINDRVIVIAP